MIYIILCNILDFQTIRYATRTSAMFWYVYYYFWFEFHLICIITEPRPLYIGILLCDEKTGYGRAHERVDWYNCNNSRDGIVGNNNNARAFFSHFLFLSRNRRDCVCIKRWLACDVYSAWWRWSASARAGGRHPFKQNHHRSIRLHRLLCPATLPVHYVVIIYTYKWSSISAKRFNNGVIDIHRRPSGENDFMPVFL